MVNDPACVAVVRAAATEVLGEHRVSAEGLPLAASEDYYTPETPGDLYADVIRELDASVGAIRGVLERAGILERTIFIFMSDNGPHYGGSTGGLKGKNARGHDFAGTHLPPNAAFRGS